MHSPYGLPVDCHSCHLHPDNFFCALSRESMQAFDQIKHTSVLPSGAVIFMEGQASRGIFLLCQGQAKLTAGSSEGKTFIVRIAKPGEVLGLQESVSGRPYALTAETMQPSQLSFVNRYDFLHFLKQHGDALLNAAQHISRECQEAYEVVRAIGLSPSVSSKLANFLLSLAADGSVRNGVTRAKLSMTHQEIAQLVGTTRETVTRTLAGFRKKNIVELKGATLIIRNKPALEQLVAA